jgi:hypothetical protein
MAQEPKHPAAARASFVRDIVSDPKNVPDVMLLYGYLGASSEENHERLYLSPDLTNYVEIPEAAIVHQMAAAKEQDPHGGVTLWVKKGAALVYRMAPAAEALAHYFAGAIQAGAAGVGAAARAAPAFTARCPTHAPACTEVGCPTDLTPCINTHGVTCGNCPSVIAACHSIGLPCNQTAAGDCTFIGCGHTLACPGGPLGQAAAAAAVRPAPAVTVGGPACGVTLPNVCQVVSAACSLNTCGVACTVGGPACGVTLPNVCQVVSAACSLNTCGVACTAGGPCLTLACTHVTPCHPTHGQPQCPFPTEVTCAPVCHASPAPFCGPHITVGAGCGGSIACVAGGQPAQAAMAARCIGGTAVATVPIVCTAACSIACPTQQGWVCGSHHTPCCPVPVHTLAGATCAFICGSQHSLRCPVSGGAFCPPVTAACPGTLACGPVQGGVDQAALGMARVATAWCSAGCSPVCTGYMCNTPAHPCTPHCPQ